MIQGLVSLVNDDINQGALPQLDSGNAQDLVLQMVGGCKGTVGFPRILFALAAEHCM